MKPAIASLLFAATAAAQVSFEVASIKPNTSGSGNDSVDTTGGSLFMRNVSLRMIIEDAYELKRYAIPATGPGDAGIKLLNELSRDELIGMTHLLKAARTEYGKLDRSLGAAELAGWAR